MKKVILASLLALGLAGAGAGAHAFAANPPSAAVAVCNNYLFSGHATSAQSIPNSTVTVLALSTIDCDSLNDWGTANNRYNVGTGEGGWYVANAEACFNGSSDTSRRLLQFRINGSSGTVQGSEQGPALNSATFSTCFDASSLVHLTDADYIQVVAAQNSGNVLDVTDARMSLLLVALDSGH